MPEIVSVSELTARVKDTLEHDFPFVWVKGQVANLSRPSSGHVYFSLKDEKAGLNVVWFRSSQRSRQSRDGFDALTGEVYEPGGGSAAFLADGKEVICGGRMTVYPPRGVYQLVAEMVHDVGMGRLHLEFEAMKRRFEELGYFEQERKRSLPRNPRRVVLITAKGSAAMRDFLRIAGERGPGGRIHLYPTLVQGDEAPARIAAAIEQANAHGWGDVVAVVRGGGSIEDLWAFNTEPVAKAIFESRIPVLAGVGHEVDVTIADMVADVRAATPTHAAQLLWEERETMMQTVDQRDMALQRAWERKLSHCEQRLEHLRRALVWLSPLQRLERTAESLGNLAGRLEQARAWILRSKTLRLEELGGRLGRAFGPETVENGARRLEVAANGLQQSMTRLLERKATTLDRDALKLDALDPERPLARGYGLVRVRATGRYLRDPADAPSGEVLDIRVQRGEVTARVEDDAAQDSKDS